MKILRLCFALAWQQLNCWWILVDADTLQPKFSKNLLKSVTWSDRSCQIRRILHSSWKCRVRFLFGVCVALKFYYPICWMLPSFDRDGRWHPVCLRSSSTATAACRYLLLASVDCSWPNDLIVNRSFSARGLAVEWSWVPMWPVPMCWCGYKNKMKNQSECSWHADSNVTYSRSGKDFFSKKKNSVTRSIAMNCKKS